MTRVCDTVQQRRVCKEHTHFRLALFPFSAANLGPEFGMGACPARSRAAGSGAHRSTARRASHRSPSLANFSSKQSSESK